MNTEVLIIGGGVLGVSLAYHLSVQKVPCILLERESRLGSHSSAKNAGMLRKLYRHPQLTTWAHGSTLLWPEQLRERYFRQTGSVIVGRELPGHHPELFQQISVERIDGTKAPAVYTATDGLLDPEGYLQALVAMTDRSFAELRCNNKVSAIRHEGRYWLAENDKGEQFTAPKVVNAAGAWLNSFLAPYCPWLEVDAAAYARHLFLVEGWELGYMPAGNCGFFWDEELGWYLREWDPQSRLVSICDRVVADPDAFVPSQEVSQELAQTMERALGAKSDPLRLRRGWHCFRTYTDDQLPIWGEDPDAPGLFWLGAFGGFGMSTSFAATLDAASALMGEPVEIASDLAPSRVKLSAVVQQSTLTS